LTSDDASLKETPLVQVVLCLGGNLGNSAQILTDMRNAVSALLSGTVVCSSYMETEPVGMPSGTPWFHNQLIMGDYSGSPFKLLDNCQSIEQSLGRIRHGGLHSRTADIDILLFGDLVMSDSRLVLPHPRMIERRFVVNGLAEIFPLGRHPVYNKTFA
jgi:2-amino-4-hydroxy-6-hydroxymethyldihydropteridine diphosphokinase